MSIVDESVQLSKKNIEVILNYLPYFEDTSQKFFDIISPKREAGNIVEYIYVKYSAKFMEFYRELHEQGFVTNFNWLDSNPNSDDLSPYYELLEDADILTLRRLFTMIVRHDKYNEGFFADVIESGLLLQMLNRLKLLKEEMD
ncbi:MAG: hypothetical protein APG12_00315 [Candidatus Methanofastidiosum methylothiophilum]|uniref:Uncharacterized protein n=1 Tax=Candidatus Methanofastidiosum methylothiophilum TaxID=1705564 RepID=A0A150J1U0_9EURY|nr:MAG: hypothetical protein APG10_00349 [Candidatus Methanofastidiosum methylthiophilus]KYC48606.1 MAG: hypothetical protein APG11_00116 [Candidatus Methanofastidiosum methylthiophilus]KYC51189.1 MAG: hypothetical protein APG12_00315 [Candidatus Methanofastidiosum methylthiophilus]